jgi:hypothetical protein
MDTEEVIGTSAVGATERPFRFEGLHYKRWQQKMYFFLTLKKVVYVLNESMPIAPTGSTSGTKPVTIDNGDKPDADKDKDKDKDKQQIDPVALAKAQDLQLLKEQQIWLNNDYLCKGYILNGLCDDLYD